MTMERETILENLGRAEKHIGQGEHQLRLHREFITELRSAGRNTAEAEAALKSGKQTLKLHFADRSRLLRELSEVGRRAEDRAFKGSSTRTQQFGSDPIPLGNNL